MLGIATCCMKRVISNKPYGSVCYDFLQVANQDFMDVRARSPVSPDFMATYVVGLVIQLAL